METLQNPAVDPIERRRMQGRMAQRRFRQKRKLQKTLTSQHGLYHGGDPTISHSSSESAIDLDLSQPLSWMSPGGHGGPQQALPPELENVNPLPQRSELLLPNQGFPSASGPGEDTHWGSSSPATNQLPSSGSTPRECMVPTADAMSTPGTPMSVLHIASQKGHERIVELLIRRKINLDDTDGDGRTPLMLATMIKDIGVMRLLLKHGARIDLIDDLGRTALHWAAIMQDENAVRLLLEAATASDQPFNVDAAEIMGWTALHIAVHYGFEAGVLMLLSHGADMELKPRRCLLSGTVLDTIKLPLLLEG